MPRGLRRFHESGQSHFLTFSCYRRKANFVSADGYELFVLCLEEMRRRFGMCIYGYVVMPEHVHLLVSEPERTTLADAIHYLTGCGKSRFCTLSPPQPLKGPLKRGMLQHR